MDEIVLTADTGRTTGTRPSRRSRTAGQIPAVVYGLDQDPLAISVEWPELRRAITTDAGLNAIIHLEVSGEKHMSIVKEIQRHPVRRDVLHVDFIRIDPDRDVTVDVSPQTTFPPRSRSTSRNSPSAIRFVSPTWFYRQVSPPTWIPMRL